LGGLWFGPPLHKRPAVRGADTRRPPAPFLALLTGVLSARPAKK